MRFEPKALLLRGFRKSTGKLAHAGMLASGDLAERFGDLAAVQGIEGHRYCGAIVGFGWNDLQL
jgi:hypothetical protein